MKPCEATRVAREKVVPWIPRANQDWRVAVETLIALVEDAQRAVDEDIKAEFGRLMDQLEESAP